MSATVSGRARDDRGGVLPPRRRAHRRPHDRRVRRAGRLVPEGRHDGRGAARGRCRARRSPAPAASASSCCSTPTARPLGLRFGMTGRLLVDGAGPDREARVLERARRAGVDPLRACGSTAAATSRMVDPRRLGGVVLDPDTRPPRDRRARRCAPRGLRDRARPPAGRPLKAWLLDQSHVAGVGNLLADEILWRAGHRPGPPGRVARPRRGDGAAPHARPHDPPAHQAGRQPHRRPPGRPGAGRHLPAGRRAAAAPHDRRPHHLLLPRPPALRLAGSRRAQPVPWRSPPEAGAAGQMSGARRGRLAALVAAAAPGDGLAARSAAALGSGWAAVRRPARRRDAARPTTTTTTTTDPRRPPPPSPRPPPPFAADHHHAGGRRRPPRSEVVHDHHDHRSTSPTSHRTCSCPATAPRAPSRPPRPPQTPTTISRRRHQRRHAPRAHRRRPGAPRGGGGDPHLALLGGHPTARWRRR